MDLSKLTELAEKYALMDYLAAIAKFDVPIPDAAILGIFAMLIFALQRSQRVAVAGTCASLQAAYAEELVSANRREHHARAELTQARREIEHERQKKRCLERGRSSAKQMGRSRPISVLREVVVQSAASL